MAIIWNQGLLQQTPAVMALYRGATPTRAGGRRRKAKKAKVARATRRSKARVTKRRKVAKGSAAMKRKMAALRAKRRK